MTLPFMNFESNASGGGLASKKAGYSANCKVTANVVFRCFELLSHLPKWAKEEQRNLPLLQ